MVRIHNYNYLSICFCRRPVPEEENWPLYSKDKPNYYIFNADGSGIGKGPRAQTCAFWNQFLPRLHNNPGINKYNSYQHSQKKKILYVNNTVNHGSSVSIQDIIIIEGATISAFFLSVNVFSSSGSTWFTSDIAIFVPSPLK